MLSSFQKNKQTLQSNYDLYLEPVDNSRREAAEEYLLEHSEESVLNQIKDTFDPPQCCRVCEYLDLIPNQSYFGLEFSCEKKVWWPSKNSCKRQKILTGNAIKEQINKLRDRIRLEHH